MNWAYVFHKLAMALMWLFVTAAGGYVAYRWWGLEVALIIGVFWGIGTMAEMSDSMKKGRR